MAKAVIIETKKIIAKPKAVRFPKVTIQGPLPFRVRFTSITVPGYGVDNVPGIGLQVIGFNNYIL
jgi:hypothetical protein